MQDNDGKLFYLSTENLNLSNWLSHIRPAPSLETSNVSIVTRDSQLYFVSTATIVTGSELLYWTDNIAKVWDDKKVNKKSKSSIKWKYFIIVLENNLILKNYPSILAKLRNLVFCLWNRIPGFKICVCILFFKKKLANVIAQNSHRIIFEYRKKAMDYEIKVF